MDGFGHRHCVMRCGPRRSRSVEGARGCGRTSVRRSFLRWLVPGADVVAVAVAALVIAVWMWARGALGGWVLLVPAVAVAVALGVAAVRLQLVSRCFGWSAGALLSSIRRLRLSWRRLEGATRP